jgi:uncharacterized protein YhdP
MDLEEDQARNNYAGEVQQQFNRPANHVLVRLGANGELTDEFGGWQVVSPAQKLGAEETTWLKTVVRV